MKSSRWSKTAALGCTVFLALSTFLALCLGAASVASAQSAPRPPDCPFPRPDNTLCWPKLKSGGQVLQEEYSDIPWAQKLGTFRGNEFDQAIVLPFLALPSGNVTYCGNKFGKQPTPQNGPAGQAWAGKCMIETGINNIFTTLRTDTLYDSTQKYIQNVKKCDPSSFNSGTCTRTYSYCPDPSGSPPQACIEVNLQVSSYWTRSTDTKNLTLTLEQIPMDFTRSLRG
jgi:hypothetical protein